MTDFQKPKNYDRIAELYALFGKSGEFRKTFYDNDWAVPYQKNGETIYFYPVTVDCYVPFHTLAQSILIDKNQSGDFEAITRSYLDYIFYLAEHDHPEHLLMLCELLLMCLGWEREYVSESGVRMPSVDIGMEGTHAVLLLRGVKYTADDFDEMRTIICEQNALELPRDDVHPDIKKAWEEVEDLRRKRAKVKICSFGDQMNVMMIKTSYTKPQLLQMTIRTFSTLLARIDTVLSYEITTLLSPYLDKDGQKQITHYLADTTRDKYKDIYIDYGEFKKNKNLA